MNQPYTSPSRQPQGFETNYNINQIQNQGFRGSPSMMTNNEYRVGSNLPPSSFPQNYQNQLGPNQNTGNVQNNSSFPSNTYGKLY